MKKDPKTLADYVSVRRKYKYFILYELPFEGIRVVAHITEQEARKEYENLSNRIVPEDQYGEDVLGTLLIKGMVLSQKGDSLV